MNTVAVRELRNDTASVVARVKAGESLVLTSRGEPVAEIRPIGEGSRPVMTWADALAIPKMDAGFKHELDTIYNDMTDDSDYPEYFGQ
jgi:prevent-host-death family protein